VKTLTIHDLDPIVERRIREEAKRTGSSLNQVMKRLLAAAIGHSSARPAMDRRKEFLDVFGVWGAAEQEEFQRATQALNTVEAGDWK
jgi:hypothetical protein